MGRDRGGADIGEALRMLDDWVQNSTAVTRMVEQQAAVERKETHPDDRDRAPR